MSKLALRLYVGPCPPRPVPPAKEAEQAPAGAPSQAVAAPSQAAAGPGPTIHRIESSPSRAKVFDAQGKELGVTPFEHEVDTMPGVLVSYTVKARGRRSVRVELPADQGEHSKAVLLRKTRSARRARKPKKPMKPKRMF